MDTYQTIVRELHACMYPERYMTPEELAHAGIALDLISGSYQWDADTLDALADVFKRHAGVLAEVIR